MEDLQWYQDRVRRLERQLAEAQGDADTLRGFIKTYRATPTMIASERDALKATLEQTREALLSITEIVSGAVIHGGTEHHDSDKSRVACKICSILAALDTGKDIES